ncbi:hypothetical protein [Sporolactobacillus inulinus]|uniref:hypothetical protein n=1 Tax=Sporolactobacillus inulinus TaxID=2078 RepID=UPI0002EE987E|nr:hypothetical protein [Sporolactobacillus inulinus]GEB76624.1 hypothetical protein SIN01_09690 [Sporolactobacillus inulinus]
MADILTFDCYGTLIDTSTFWEELEKIATEHGINKALMVNTYRSFEERLMYG